MRISNSYARPPKPRTLRMPITHAGFGVLCWRCQRDQCVDCFTSVCVLFWGVGSLLSACPMLISLEFRAHAYTNDRSFGQGLAGPQGVGGAKPCFRGPKYEAIFWARKLGPLLRNVGLGNGRGSVANAMQLRWQRFYVEACAVSLRLMDSTRCRGSAWNGVAATATCPEVGPDCG